MIRPPWGLSGVTDAVLELKLFVMLEGLPLKEISSLLGIVLVIVFFTTSSDSGSLVIDTITAGGKVDAPVPQRVFWAVIEGVIAIALLLGGAGCLAGHGSFHRIALRHCPAAGLHFAGQGIVVRTAILRGDECR